MTRKRTHTIDTQKLAVLCVGSLILVLFALYIYFVSASVLHVVMRQEVEQHSAALKSEIAQLEAQYIHAQHAVSEQVASLEGYVATEQKVFIDRNTAPTVALSSVQN